ncbi:hypothetical protein D9757_012925 [Collybiopsis confluens]|uniref:tyrosinase n=1 Tax=Collybiopsis confluens TaxID=2823264 RepID=A0A8H5LR22_9AGAR|nr:hypothetical protein D9757_012925 [Collybiopsis confluens]
MSLESPVIITGRKDTGGTYPRLSIADLQKEPDQFLLFIVSFLIIQGRVANISTAAEPHHALVALQEAIDAASAPRDSPAMLYQSLGGIHGLPYQEWAGDPKAGKNTDYDANNLRDMNARPPRFGGYCNHGSVLFPTWHRPYVMAIEQSIGEIADRVAYKLEHSQKFQPQRWSDAAKRLRFPWWDWAAEDVATNGLPTVLSCGSISYNFTDDTGGVFVLTLENPLSFYPFKGLPPGFKNKPGRTASSWFGTWMRTVRYGPNDPQAPIDSDTDTLNQKLKAEAECIRHRTATLFALPRPDVKITGTRIFDEFSNHTTESNTKQDVYTGEPEIDSLEGVHDSMHDVLGGNGHMGDPDYAGFDPIFFLHHCNVDRLYALWEYVYPDDCFMDEESFTQNHGTYNLVYSEGVAPRTSLWPFRTDPDNYWTSDQARRFEENDYPKYYTYPPVRTVNGDVNVSAPASVEERELYREGLQTYYGLEKSLAKLPEGFSRQISSSGSRVGIANLYAIQDMARTVISIQTPEYAFDGPYSIQLHYTIRKTIFARQPESDCANCKKKRALGTLIHGIIIIPPRIIKEIRGIVKEPGSALPTSFADELKAESMQRF